MVPLGIFPKLSYQSSQGRPKVHGYREISGPVLYDYCEEIIVNHGHHCLY